MRHKNALQILILLVTITGLLSLTLTGSVQSAGAEWFVMPTPTPTKKPAAKTTPKPTPKPTAKPVATPAPATQQQIIVSVAAARIRSQASTSSPELKRVKLGTLIKVIEKNKDWYKIQVPGAQKPTTGWISSQVAGDFDPEKKDDIYKKIADRNFKAEEKNFVNAAELFEFLNRVRNEVKAQKLAADFGYKSLLSLRLALAAIPFDKDNEKPYKEFLTVNKKSIVYSDPAGQYFVVSRLFWDMQKKYSSLPIAEDIAWAGAQNPLPGECEGYVPCYLFLLRETAGNYLDLYPNGKQATNALADIKNFLDPITADLKDKSIYSGPTDVSDRAEFNRLISELRAIVSRIMTAEADKQKIIAQLNQIAEAFR